MKLSTRQDVEAPIEFVFERAADFDAHLRQALRRGIDARRTDALTTVDVGMSWQAQIQFRGKPRKIIGQLCALDGPNGFEIQSSSGGIDSVFSVEFLPLSPRRTRIRAGLDLRPSTLSARLLIQSLKLGKHRLNERFSHRIARFAEETEGRFAVAQNL